MADPYYSDAPERVFVRADYRWSEYRISILARDPGEYVRADLYAALEAENERMEVAIRLVLPHLVPTHRVFKRLAAALEEGGDDG